MAHAGCAPLIHVPSGWTRDVEGCRKAKAERAVSGVVVELTLACIAEGGALFCRKRCKFRGERRRLQEAAAVGGAPSPIGDNVDGFLTLDNEAALAQDAVDERGIVQAVHAA